MDVNRPTGMFWQQTRAAGLLLPVFSLSSRYGIGTLGREAERFVAFLNRAKQRYWQILPLGPTGEDGNSPYKAFSMFAGNPYAIDLDQLCEIGLLEPKEIRRVCWGHSVARIDYTALYRRRVAVLRRAFERFRADADAAYAAFCAKEAYWLEDYALFMAIKGRQDGRPWQQWEETLRKRRPGALADFTEQNAEELAFWRFVQYQFQRQWNRLKRQARQSGIGIIGDLSIYPADDSVDVWAHPELFLLDEDGFPRLQAGCPPDAFSDAGQLWGNPVYHWDAMKRQGYRWWIDCLRRQAALYDVVRLDHFRGFEAFYVIPAGDLTSERGQWLPGPGLDFFRVAEKELGSINIIAENLGELTPESRRLHAESGYPGMKVLQFAFDSDDSEHLPCHIEADDVAYVGTHDNPTARQWFGTLSKKARGRCLRYMDIKNGRGIAGRMVELALGSKARLAIITPQDYLGLGKQARVNLPGSGRGNWRWRARRGMFSQKLADKIAAMTVKSGRAAAEFDTIK